MKPPYPVELVPLFPEFLTKRRTKFTLPLRLMEELGIDRPALFFAIGGVAPQGGGRFEDGEELGEFRPVRSRHGDPGRRDRDDSPPRP